MTLDFSTKESTEASALADSYIALGGKSAPANYKDFFNYYSNLKVIFIERLTTEISKVDLDILTLLDKDYNLTQTVDPECKQRWFPLAILKNYTAAVEPAHTFISSQGRLKYLTPIYQALLKSGQRPLAVQWFHENEDFYHPLAVASLKKLLGLNEEQHLFSRILDTIKDQGAKFIQ